MCDPFIIYTVINMCHDNVINCFAGHVNFVSICDRLHLTANNVSVLQDMSAYVKKVHFKLHESYPNPNRGLSAFVTTVTDSCSMHFQWLEQHSSRCTLHTRGRGEVYRDHYTLYPQGGGGGRQFAGSTIHFTHKG